MSVKNNQYIIKFHELSKSNKKFLHIHGIDEHNIEYIKLIKKALINNLNLYLEDSGKNELFYFINNISKDKTSTNKILAKDNPLLYFNYSNQNLEVYKYLGFIFSEKLYELLNNKKYYTPQKLNFYRQIISSTFKLIEKNYSDFLPIFKKYFEQHHNHKNIKIGIFKLITKLGEYNITGNIGNNYLKKFNTFVYRNFKKSEPRKTINYSKMLFDFEYKKKQKRITKIYLLDEEEENQIELISHESKFSNILGKNNSIINRNRTYFPSRMETISLNELSFLHKLIKSLLRQNIKTNYLLPLLCLILSCHTGIPYEVWLNILLKKEKFIKINQEYSYYSYSSSKDKITIYIPNLLKNLITSVMNNKIAQKKYISFKGLFEFFRNNCKKFGIDKINGIKINNFFKYYYPSFFECDTLILEYVSCSQTSYTDAPKFYTKLPLDEINNCYQEAFKKIINSTGGHIENSKFYTSDNKYVGSKRVLQDKTLKEIFFRLNLAINKSNIFNSFQVFNLKNFKIVLIIQLITGLRHRNYYSEDIIKLLKLNNDSWALAISDKKQNKKKLYRIIPIIREIEKILIDHKAYVNKFIEKLKLKYNTIKLDHHNRLILFLDVKTVKNTTYITEQKYNMDYINYLFGLLNGYKTIPDLKEFKSNSLRHYLRTFLHNEKEDEVMINEILGHSNIQNCTENGSICSIKNIKLNYQNKLFKKFIL